MPGYTNLEGGGLTLSRLVSLLTTPLPGPPDGGVFGWGATAATFVAVGVCVALEGTYGQLAVGIFEDTSFGASRSFLSWVISFQVFMELGAGIPVAHAVLRYGPRAVVAAGGLLLGVGIFLAASATTPALFFMAYALCGGTGLALVYGGSSMALGMYFTHNAAAASSLSGAGAGVGQMLMSQLIEYLSIRHGDWRLTLRVLGCLCGALCVLSSLAFVPVGPAPPAPSEPLPAAAEAAPAAAAAAAAAVEDVKATAPAPQPLPAPTLPPLAFSHSPLLEADSGSGEQQVRSLRGMEEEAASHRDSLTTAPRRVTSMLRIRATGTPPYPSATSASSTPTPTPAAPAAATGSVTLVSVGAPPSPFVLPPPLPGTQHHPSPLLLGKGGTATAASRISAASVVALNMEGGNTFRPGVRSRLASSSSSSNSINSLGEVAAAPGEGKGGSPNATLQPQQQQQQPLAFPASSGAGAAPHPAPTASATATATATPTPPPPPPPHIFTSSSFWVIALCMAFHVSAATIPEVHLGTYIAEQGLPSHVAAACYTLMGLAGLGSRVLLGALALRVEMNMLLLLQFVVVVLGMAMMGLASHGGSADYLYFYALVSGAATNLSISCVSPVLLQVFGAEALPSALGGTYTLRAPAVLLAAPLAALLVDALHGYAVLWTLTGVLCCLSALPVCLANMGCRLRERGVAGGGG